MRLDFREQEKTDFAEISNRMKIPEQNFSIKREA